MKKNTLSISILISMLIWDCIFMFINPDIAKYSKKIIETSLIQAFCKTRFKENSKDYQNLLKRSIEKYENFEYRIVKVS